MKVTKFEEEKLYIKVYDVETKQPILELDNYRKGADALGVSQVTLKYRIEKKQRFLSPKLNKEITCRIVRREEVANVY